MMKTKKLPNNQLGFFLLKYAVYVSNNYSVSLEIIIESIEKMAIGESKNLRANFIQFEIADSDYYGRDRIEDLNKWINEIRKEAEKYEYYELCYNLMKINTLITSGLTMYNKVETY